MFFLVSEGPYLLQIHSCLIRFILMCIYSLMLCLNLRTSVLASAVLSSKREYHYKVWLNAVHYKRCTQNSLKDKFGIQWCNDDVFLQVDPTRSKPLNKKKEILPMDFSILQKITHVYDTDTYYLTLGFKRTASRSHRCTSPPLS